MVHKTCRVHNGPYRGQTGRILKVRKQTVEINLGGWQTIEVLTSEVEITGSLM